MESRQLVESSNLLADPRFNQAESVLRLGPCAVLVVPLRHGGEVWGFLSGALWRQCRLSNESRSLVVEFTEMAGLCLRTALEKESLHGRSHGVERDSSPGIAEGIVTQAPAMLAMLQVVAQAAASDATVSRARAGRARS